MDVSAFEAALSGVVDRIQRDGLDAGHRTKLLDQLLQHSVFYLTDHHNIRFTTYFARISFLCSTHKFSFKESFLIHQYRKLHTEGLLREDAGHIILLEQVLNVVSERCFNLPPPFASNIEAAYRQWRRGADEEWQSYYPEKMVFLQEILPEKKILKARSYAAPYEKVIVRFDQPDFNEDYGVFFSELAKNSCLPVMCNLVQVKVNEKGHLYPSSFVLEPDCLYDVTSISECFGAFETHELGYMLRRFVDKPPSMPIIIGNVANYFLDQLIFNPDQTFDVMVGRIFQLYPLSLTRFSDSDIKEMIGQLRRHFTSIKEMVTAELPGLGLTIKTCYLEPAFYSAKYGIQGRLDLFTKSGEKASIVELKSGAPFRPNAYGMSNSHYHQTLLYDMLIESVYTNQVKRTNFLLYSREQSRQLRFAPVLKSEQREALKVRNRCWMHDQALANDDNDVYRYIKNYVSKSVQSVKGFLAGDLEDFEGTLKTLSPLERDYFNRGVGFVIREQYLAKLGDESQDRLKGLASLWRDSLSKKQESFNIINHLEIVENKAIEEDPKMVLKRSPITSELHNFRIGDVAVFYPELDRRDSILKSQVFKCSVTGLNEESVTIRLRSKQENAAVFRAHDFWHLEHDVLENGYHAMTKSLFTFMKSPDRKRSVLMGVANPECHEPTDVKRPEGMTDEQYEILRRAVAAEEYYLLWGPPGTGKTSIVFKALVDHHYQQRDKRMLLLAYTNRAVDEMCHAIGQLDINDEYVRIGSRYSTSETYKPLLLQERIRTIKNRRDMRQFLDRQRIVIGTVASIMGRADLFDLLKFDIAIVDEASQILEPALVGLLSRVSKFILIGDHLQLPAVVLQDEKNGNGSKADSNISQVGITSFSNSLFERMYLRARKMAWTHAFGTLTFQGRMHVDLMVIPNELYYEGALQPLPGIDRLKSASVLDFRIPKHLAYLSHRLIFVPSETDLTGENLKVNRYEADWVVRIIKDLMELYRKNDRKLEEDSIGVITPFRAQIATILSALRELEDEWASLITVDTVERYQGGARDVILFSTAINAPFHMGALVSLSDDGIDRKLNVAFTRAREQFILIGNESFLSASPGYAHIMSSSYKLN